MDCNGALISATLFNNHVRVNDILSRYPGPALTSSTKQEALRIACVRGFVSVVREIVHTGHVIPDEHTMNVARTRVHNVQIMRILRSSPLQ